MTWPDFLHTVEARQANPASIVNNFYCDEYDDMDGETRWPNTQLINALHASCGISTEVAEFMDGWDKLDEVNCLEELGDLYWFTGQLILAINYEVPDDSIDSLSVTVADLDAFIKDLITCAGDILNVVKKYFAYGKEGSLHDDLKTQVTFLLHTLEVCCLILGTTPEEVRTKNDLKLAARYGSVWNKDNALNRDYDREAEAVK